jgi:hypothetical protein
MTGWNTRDDLDGMEATDAVIMDNWYADAGGLMTRKGSLPFATGMTGPCETIGEYYSGATRKLIACSGGKIYDISSGSPTVLGTGYANNIWITTNFSGRMFLANGQDVVQRIDLGTIAPAGFTGPTTSPIGILTFRGRLYLWEANSPKFWYAPPGFITGALAAFDVSTIAQHGGNILTLTNFSHDGGDGSQNTFAIVMTTGEVLLYQGNDPGTSSTWSLVGKYKLGAPINARSVAPHGGDVYLTTTDDHVPLQQQLSSLQNGIMPPRSKITGAVNAAIQACPAGYGFQAMYYGTGRRVIFNAPSTENPGTYEQHVLNTSNGAWQRFVGMNALCWTEFNGKLYFGKSTGEVWQADVGPNDDGNAIMCNAQQAWSNLGMAAGKRVAGVRPIVQSTAGQTYTFRVGYDYGELKVAISPFASFSSASFWDVSTWDVALWTPEAQINPSVHAAAGSGTSVSFALDVAALTRMIWMRTDLVVEGSKQI